MNTPTSLTQLPVRSYFSKDTAKSFTDWNTRVTAINRQRAEIAAAADKLRDGIMTTPKPEKVPEQVRALQARRLGLDVQELRLAQEKESFGKTLLDERRREQERLEGLIEKRKAEILKALDKGGIRTAFLPAVLSADATILALQSQRAAVTSHEKAVTENDQLRGAFLLARVQAAVPVI